VEVQKILNTDLRATILALDALFARDLSALNALLSSKSLPPVTLTPRRPISH
jgi:hypothetical protein